VAGMIRMMGSEPEFLGPVNLGNPNEFTMLELPKQLLN
jgi:UDP-glucuronate decarboxylase